MPETKPPPFEESVAEGSLRRIAEAARDRAAKHKALERAKLAYKSAREDYDGSCLVERQAIDVETNELPLFPRPRPDTPAAASSGAAPAADPDRATFLSQVPGIPAQAAIALGAAGLVTVRDLVEYLADARLADLGTIDARMEAKVLAALERHRGRLDAP